MSPIHVSFPCGEITLEGEWHFPDGEGPFPAVVVSHPHPLYGGSMDNNVVLAVSHELYRDGVAALRFNFRGVGKSGGSFGGGNSEKDDIKAALTFVASTPKVDSSRLGLVGYSFGGGVALAVANEDERVKCLALVSPALVGVGRQLLRTFQKPRLVVLGDTDTFVPSEDFLHNLNLSPNEFQVFPGVDHFWWGHEAGMAKTVADFFLAGFKPQE